MNGRVERFFGTLKEKLAQHVIQSCQQLDRDLASFLRWYHYVRPHHHLNGKTPMEALTGKRANGRGDAFYFNQWDGLLTGFYLPPD